MAEKELKKAIKRELQDEREERIRQETKNIEKRRREPFFISLEEPERLEEEIRETRIRERERRREDSNTKKRRILYFGMKNESPFYPRRSQVFLSFHISLYLFKTPGPLLMTSSQAARTAAAAVQTTAQSSASTRARRARHLTQRKTGSKP